MLRVRGDVITVELSVVGFRLPPADLARRVVEAAERLPRPDEDAADSLDGGLAALSGLQEAMASGGFAAFAAMARQHLGLDNVPSTLPAAPEHDRALADHLGGVVHTLRETAAASSEPEAEPIFAEAATPEGDVVVVSASDRTIAEVRLGMGARQRGVEGLGEALTETVARARAELRARSEEQVRGRLPDELRETIDTGPAATEAFARDGSVFLESTRGLGDDMKRRISERS